MTEAALNPRVNAVVAASAGTGKTWQLTARILRLLLDGAEPGGILALTFTRKAAAEMQARVYARLREFAWADEARLKTLLAEIGAPADAVTEQRARQLYEDLLFTPAPLRATTLHAFCQDLVTRFAWHTGTSPGVELVESENSLKEAAWQAVQSSLLHRPDSEEMAALETLVALGCSEYQIRGWVSEFLEHRNDWRARFAEEQAPVAALRARMESRLGVTEDSDPYAQLNDAFIASLKTFHSYLQQAAGIGSFKAAALEPALALRGGECLERLTTIFFTQQFEPRLFSIGAEKRKKLGSGIAEQCEQHHAQIVLCLQTLREQALRQKTLRRTLAVATLGQATLGAFDDLLQQRQQLTFAELEWRASRLLADPEAGAWVQYRLDAQLSHLLLDEFQDTSETQWRLLLPLLEEMAAGSERPRSAFVVGDRKQSIYGFRRANAQLMDSASDFIAQRMGGERLQLAHSWRSAPAILNFVNALFTQPDVASLMPNFPAHQAQRKELWGQIEVAPLIQASAKEETEIAFRNPLTTARPDPENDRAHREGVLIAQRIQRLLAGEAGFAGRRLSAGSIMILLRKRTHQQALEQALSDAGIPFIGAARGTLLETVEGRDLLALLRFLASPVRDLDLAHALRSPWFDFSDGDLAHLAQTARSCGGWWPALQQLAEQPDTAHFRPAVKQLGEWLQLARRLPAHDVLDHMLSAADAAARYEAALPPAQATRVRANFGALTQLLLDTDQGRYPSLPRVLGQLQSQQGGTDGPDQAPPPAGTGAVRILSIHAAKGLEADAVFVAQATAGAKADGGGWCVNWPTGMPKPEDFVLIGNKGERDALSAQLLGQQAARAALEELNLFYVACTRARQFLHISGFELRGGGNWLQLAGAAMQALGINSQQETLVYTSGVPISSAESLQAAPAAVTADARLRQPLALLTPSCHSSAARDPAAVRRGNAIHLLLKELTEGASETRALQLLKTCLHPAPQSEEVQAWLAETLAVIRSPELARFFDPTRYVKAWSELPMVSAATKETELGVIDRLVDDGESLWVLDYKTEHTDDEQLLTEKYRRQLQGYVQGLLQMHPQRQIRAGLILTASARWLPVPVEKSDRIS